MKPRRALRLFALAFLLAQTSCLILPSTPRTVITIHNVRDHKHDVALAKAVCDAVATRHQMEIVDVNWGSDKILTYNRVQPGLFGKGHGPPSIVLNYNHPNTISVIVGGGMDFDMGHHEVASDMIPALQRYFRNRTTWFDDKWTEF